MQSVQSLCRWDRPKHFVKLDSRQAVAGVLDICGLEQKALWEDSLQTTEIAFLWMLYAEV